MKILIAILGLALLAAIIAIITSNTDTSGWKCTENGCEYGTDGDYATQQKCMDVCNNEVKKMIKEKLQIEKEDEESEDDEEIKNWACTSDYKCIRAEEGKFTSKENCEELCIKPESDNVYMPYYYPQSLYYYNMPYRYRPYRHRPIRRRPIRPTPSPIRPRAIRPINTTPIRRGTRSFRIR